MHHACQHICQTLLCHACSFKLSRLTTAALQNTPGPTPVAAKRQASFTWFCTASVARPSTARGMRSSCSAGSWGALPPPCSSQPSSPGWSLSTSQRGLKHGGSGTPSQRWADQDLHGYPDFRGTRMSHTVCAVLLTLRADQSCERPAHIFLTRDPNIHFTLLLYMTACDLKPDALLCIF